MRIIKRLFLILIAICTFSTGILVYADATEDYKTFSQLDDRWASYVYGGNGGII